MYSRKGSFLIIEISYSEENNDLEIFFLLDVINSNKSHNTISLLAKTLLNSKNIKISSFGGPWPNPTFYFKSQRRLCLSDI